MYSRGDEAPLRGLLADDVVWHVPGDNAIAGRYVGPDAVIDYMRRRRALADATFRMHVEAVLDGDGPYVAAVTHGTATIRGVDHSWSTVGLYRIEDGLLAECRLLAFDQAAFDAIWSG